MSGILLGLFTVVLILVSAFLVLIILMQRASANSGMGSALGGGAAESALGGEAGNVLTKLTVKAAVVFFVVAFGLYLGHMARFDANESVNMALPTIESASEEQAEPVGSGLTAIEETLEDAAAISETTQEGVESVTTEVEAGVEGGEATTTVEQVDVQVEEAGALVEGAAEQLEESVPVTTPDASEPVQAE